MHAHARHPQATHTTTQTQDVADAIAQMHMKGRYRELLLIVETCQAATLYSKIQ
jgi:glycosylphosphatidylinositol transamidase (GPIT) subunit GPI8